MYCHATQASTQCPDTKLVLSGYSQGGQLVHNAATNISSTVTDFVAAGEFDLPLGGKKERERKGAPMCIMRTCQKLTVPDLVLIYGDPYDGEPVGNISSSKVMVYCHPLDGICAGTGILTPSHGTYDKNALEAAEWVASTLGY